MSSAKLQISGLGKTFREIRNYRDLFMMLIAFWVYANGIGTSAWQRLTTGAAPTRCAGCR